MEENSLVDDEQPQYQYQQWHRPPLPSNRRSANAVNPPAKVFYPRQNHYDDEEEEDDDFVCNPSPNLRAPAVITVPVATCGKPNRRQSSNAKRFSTSKRQRNHDCRSSSSSSSLRCSPTQAMMMDDDFRDYALRLLSNILFLVSSCLYLQVAIWKLKQNETENFDDDDDAIDNVIDDDDDDEKANEVAVMILSLSSSIGFFLVGCLELYMAETFWTQFLVGGMMILASLLGVTATVLSMTMQQQQQQQPEGIISAIVSAVSLHAYAVVAVSIFVLHEDFTDEVASTTTSRGESVDSANLHAKPPQVFSQTEPSAWWRRLADNAFMIGTILDAVLSYFHIFDMASAATALPIASVGAACCWILAAVLYLVVTIQSGQECDSKTSNNNNKHNNNNYNNNNNNNSGRGCCRCCCCLFCCFHSKPEKDSSDKENSAADNVTITVVEGDNTSSSKQDSKVEEGFLSYYSRQIMEPNFDSLCAGVARHQQQLPCVPPSMGEGMTAAQLRSSAKDLMKHVDSVFDQHIFCGS